METAEALQTARHEKVLEVELGQSYGELTSMEIDPPQEVKISLCELYFQLIIFPSLPLSTFYWNDVCIEDHSPSK